MIRFEDDGTIKAVRDRFSKLRVDRVASPVMSRAGGNMQRATYDRALKTAHLTIAGTNVPDYAAQIKFKKDGPLAVEVFALKRGQGSLAAVLEYGYGHNMAVPHFMPSLDEEIWPTAAWLGKVIADELNK